MATQDKELLAFVDSGATENFISKKFTEEHNLGTQRLKVPRTIINADGTKNKGGNIEAYSDLEVTTGKDTCMLRFFIADFNKDNLVLGYPWLASNPVINWMKGLMASSVVIQTSGAAKKAPIEPVKAVHVAGMRTVIHDCPFLQKGVELWMQFRKMTIST